MHVHTVSRLVYAVHAVYNKALLQLVHFVPGQLGGKSPVAVTYYIVATG